jgi:hypothetical protein
MSAKLAKEILRNLKKALKDLEEPERRNILDKLYNLLHKESGT